MYTISKSFFFNGNQVGAISISNLLLSIRSHIVNIRDLMSFSFYSFEKLIGMRSCE